MGRYTKIIIKFLYKEITIPEQSIIGQKNRVEKLEIKKPAGHGKGNLAACGKNIWLSILYQFLSEEKLQIHTLNLPPK